VVQSGLEETSMPFASYVWRCIFNLRCSCFSGSLGQGQAPEVHTYKTAALPWV